MLRVRVCAAHMGGFWVQNSLNKGPFFGRFSIKMRGLSRNWRTIAKNGSFPSKIHYNSGYDRVSVIRRGYLSENRTADPRPSASHLPPPPEISML